MIVLLDEFKDLINLESLTLILPSVSVGNAGQLAADLLISTLELRRIGFIRHRNIEPVVAQSGTQIATECELYASIPLNVLVVQIRSSYGPFNSISAFLGELCSSVKCVVILTGSHAFERKHIHLVDEPIKYLSTAAFQNINVPSLPKMWQKLSTNDELHEKVRIPGSGIGDHLFQMCSVKNVPAVIIVIYLSEGDNRNDAIALVDFIDMWLQLRSNLSKSEKSWCAPQVWSSLFGNGIPNDLF